MYAQATTMEDAYLQHANVVQQQSSFALTHCSYKNSNKKIKQKLKLHYRMYCALLFLIKWHSSGIYHWNKCPEKNKKKLNNTAFICTYKLSLFIPLFIGSTCLSVAHNCPSSTLSPKSYLSLPLDAPVRVKILNIHCLYLCIHD